MLAGTCYARSEGAAAEVLINRAEELLRRVGASFELGKTALADGIGLRESAVGGEPPPDRTAGRPPERTGEGTRR